MTTYYILESTINLADASRNHTKKYANACDCMACELAEELVNYSAIE